MNSYLSNIGRNIKVLRVAREIKQKELASQLGITQNYLSMIENGAKTPSLSLLEKLAQILNIPMNLIFNEPSFV